MESTRFHFLFDSIFFFVTVKIELKLTKMVIEYLYLEVKLTKNQHRLSEELVAMVKSIQRDAENMD